jgi:lysozyme family protein
MAEFNAAIGMILQHEGGYVNNPNDPGGETNYGISKRSYPGVNIRGLTPQIAAAIYQRDFWNPLLLDEVNNQALATKILDTCVNLGKGAGVKYLQRALLSLGAAVAVDGAMGPATIAAVNSVDPVALLAAYRQILVTFYEGLVAEKPRDSVFEQGWLNRANA